MCGNVNKASIVSDGIRTETLCAHQNAFGWIESGVLSHLQQTTVTFLNDTHKHTRDKINELEN